MIKLDITPVRQAEGNNGMDKRWGYHDKRLGYRTRSKLSKFLIERT